MNTEEAKYKDFKTTRASHYSHIKGWAIDADPKNDPTYPMRDRTHTEDEGRNWDRPPKQSNGVEILQSVEHKSLPAVYGAPNPPEGLSGKLRRLAFKYSESHYGHWLSLMLADRVQAVEGVAEDLQRGHIPNVFEEMGMGAEWKYNKRGFIAKAAVIAVATAAIVSVFVSKKRQKTAA